MSILLSGRVKVALGVLTAALAFLFIPVSAGANTCGVMSKTFHCMTGATQRSALLRKVRQRNSLAQKSYRVAAARSRSRMNDAGKIARPARKPAKKARRIVRKSKKAKRSRRIVRRHKKSFRQNKSLRTIGRRMKLRASRRLTRKSKKRGWRSRSRGLGYVAASRGVSTSCFPARLRKLLNKVSAHYGRKLRITSGFRSRRHNRRIGGARRSQHIHCTAADFYIPGVNKMSLARYLKRLPGRGGVGTYCGNRTVHLDIGARRTWHWGCRKSRKRRHAKSRRFKRHSSVRRNARKRRVARFRGSKS